MDCTYSLLEKVLLRTSRENHKYKKLWEETHDQEVMSSNHNINTTGTIYNF